MVYDGSEWVEFEKMGGGAGTIYGYILGGDDGGSDSSIDRITFPFDSGTSTHVGNLSYSRYYNAGCDGTDFCTLFID